MISPDQEIAEGGGEEDPRRPHVVLGVEEAVIRLALVTALTKVAGQVVVARGTSRLSESVPPVTLRGERDIINDASIPNDNTTHIIYKVTGYTGHYRGDLDIRYISSRTNRYLPGSL